MNIGDRVLCRFGRGYIKYKYIEQDINQEMYIVYIDEPFKLETKCHRILANYEVQTSTKYKVGDKIKNINFKNHWERGIITKIYGDTYGFQVKIENESYIYVQEESNFILDN